MAAVNLNKWFTLRGPVAAVMVFGKINHIP